MTQSSSIEQVLDAVEALPDSWHEAGALARNELETLVRHVGGRNLSHSMETGSGASTLLLSHMSDHHQVFSVDFLGSLVAVTESPLLRKESVQVIEGPTQVTLPKHRFEPLQLALLDGPHAYPFPELEYYHVYPHLDTGALLIIDDVWIPTVFNLFCFLREDKMFDLVEVEGKMAVFRRTAAPTFDPEGDWWWEQRYNVHYYPVPSWAWSYKLHRSWGGVLKGMRIGETVVGLAGDRLRRARKRRG